MAAVFLQTSRAAAFRGCIVSFQRCMQSRRLFRTIAVEVDKNSEEFIKNAKSFAKKREYFKLATNVACAGGGEKVIASHRKRGKLLADERLQSVLDEGSEFLELSTLAGLGMDYGNVPRAGIITGIGKVCGVYCYFCVNDSTVKGGTMYPISVTKQLRAQQIAIDNRLPCIYITDSGGAFLPLQDEIFPDKHHGGRGFYNEAILSSLGVPQVAVVCGHCTAGGAYIPTMSQEAVIVHKIGAIFLGGPPLVYAALGEKVDTEELGGATLHCKESGCTDYFSLTEPEAYGVCREIVETFNMKGPLEHQNYEEPVYDPKDLDGLIPHKSLHKLDAMQVIARIVDGSKFHEFKQMYGKGLLTGFGKIHGHLVGIVANQGELCGDSATKGSHFVQLCDQRNIPLIFLQNTWPVDECQESSDKGYTLRCHAHMLSSVSCATVPKFTIKMGNDMDHTAFAMCGQALDATFVFSWPHVKSYNVDKQELLKGLIKKRFPKGVDEDSEEYQKFFGEVVLLVEHKASPLYSSSLMKDDGVILPEDTRKTLAMCLGITSQPPPGKEVSHGVIRM